MTSVLVLAFNRPECTRALAKRLASFDDVEVFVSVDGPRPGNAKDAESVAEVRETLYSVLGTRIAMERESESNLGCADGVAAGLTWFFDQVDEGVILEDDCLPTPEFMAFTRAGLEAFRGQHGIGAICGSNFAPAALSKGSLAVRSRYFHLWGWATWKRAMEGFSVRPEDWRSALKASPEWKSMNPIERRDWRRMFAVADEEHPHTWDYQFVMHQWLHGRDSVLPSIPLVQNIGFAGGAHHAGDPPGYYYESSENERSPYLEVKSGDSLPLPARSSQTDRWISRNVFSPPISSRLARRLRSLR